MTYNKKNVEDIAVKGKRVLVRCDFNVPLKDGVITSDKRIVEALPTIKYLLDKGAKLILCSHMGKPHSILTEGFGLTKKEKKKGRVKEAWKGFKSEVKKIVWPSGKQVLKNTLVVLVVLVVCAVVIGLLDYAFAGGFNALVGLFSPNK